MKYRIFLSAAAVALMAGCDNTPTGCGFTDCGVGLPGGGGGIGAGGLMEVDADSAPIALREAWYATISSADTPFLVAATGIGDTSGGTASTGSSSKIGSGVGVQVDPFGPTVYNCPVSGTFTISGDVADPLTLTVGDTVTYDSSACDSGTGYTVNGMHQIDVDAVSGDILSGLFIVTETFSFTGFQANTATNVTTLNGDHTVTIDTEVANTIQTVFSGNSLTIEENGVTMAINSYSGAAYLTAAEYLLDAAGRANTTIVTGSFNYDTTKTIQQRTGERAHDGVVNIYGDNSKARIIIIDATTIRLQVDDNNSDNYELSVDVSWDDFLAGVDVTP